jgi:amino acid adenylation domain-containing protein/non-ribosomal peptide synthase protein (TIGR01720 family)
VAYAVPEPGWELSPADLRHALAETLPDFMVPASIVLLDELPRTAHGKLDRAALPVPGALDGHTPAYAAPRTPAEEVLAGVWAEVLRRPRVGIHDDFFAMGGDSILSIQITTRAQRQGVHITPRLLFQHPTVAELAAVSGTVEETEAEPEPVAGPIPLTPIQRWFFAAAPDEPHHFNQAVLLATRGRPDTRTLSAALAAIEAHHDALRLRFRRGEAGWEPEGRGLASGPTEAPLTVVDLSALAEAAQPLQIEAAAAQAQASLHLEQGPIHRTLLLDCGAARPGRLFWAAHHLAVDGVSWRVLLDDLASAYGRIAAGAPPGLPPKTTSFRRWAERLAGLAASGSGREELPFWLGLPWSAAAPLPAEVPPATGPDIIAAERTVAFTLDEDETQALLQEVPRAYNTRINDALLSALARAFQEWTGSPVLPVDLEGHGREEILPGVDLSRTVGWFTSLYPVLLDLRQGSGVAGALKAVKEQLRRVPNGGIGYGLLRWWPDTAAELAALPQPEISFNYLGQLGGPSEVSPFGPARESAGPPRSPAARRRHRLDWNGTVFAGRLRLTCTYSERRDRRETIERLASSVAAKLRELIAHCRSAEAGGYTPSDFPLAAHLSQDRLDALVAARRSPGGTARPIDDVYPVSPMQEGMLFHALYAPERGSYVWQLSCRIVGPLDLPVFRRAWERVLARHDILRTAFVWEDLETPLQVVSREPLLPLEVRDWSGATPAGQRALLEEYLDHDQRRGFDLRQSPLIRLLLAREAADRHRLVWSTQMLLLDGWSMAAVIGDVFLSYDAFLRGEDPQPPLPRRYRDYIEWLLRQDRSAAEPIWRRELAGFPAATPLPGDLGVHGRSGHAGAGSQEQRRTLVSAGDTSALQSYARRNGLTLNTLVQGAWSLLLGRANGETDIVFGATVSGRPPELTGIESMVGLFINTLPVRARIEPEANLADWLRDLQERHTEVRQYEHTPLRDIQGWSDVPRGQQLFDSVVVFESYPVDTSLRERRGTLGTDEVRLLETTNYPLVLAVVPGRQLSLQLTWDTSRFQSATVARLLERLAAVLAGLPAGGRLRDVPAVPAAERHQVLYEWSRGGDLPGIRPVVERFAEQAARTPDAPALVFAGRWVTYGELDAQAGRVARRLAALGVGPGAAVGLCTERSPEMIAGLLGIWRAGGAYLPLDPSYPDARLAFLLQDSLGGGERGAAAVVLTPAALVNRLSTLAPGGCHFAVLEEALAGPDGGGALPRAGLDDPAYLIYTSGTTGAPKAVVVEHRNLASTLAAASAFDFTAADRMPCLAPFSFDIFLFELLGPLLAGGTSHLFALQPALDLAGLVESLGEATLLHAVPALMRQVAEAARDRGPYPGLRAVFVGGDAVPADLLAELPALFPRARVHVLYGPTEATIICCSQTVDPGVAAGPGATLLGRPLPNAEIALLDRWGDPAPIGAPGELCIGGGSVARGYLSRPELDAERFFVRDGRRFYRSGDLARWSPAGRLEFLGRIDHQVKVRGFRIELGEIEAALAAQPGVREAVATVREDGAGNRRLVAYAVPEAGRALDPAELRRALAERLPDYMVPAFVVPLEVLPLTAHGKVDHRALPEPVAAAPEAGEGALPRTRVESLLAGIWAEVLRLPRVGIHDNFFALGGDSILSIQVTTRAQRLGIAISPGLVFQHPTIAELAAVAGTGRSAQAEQGPVTGPVPLLPVQRQFLENDPADPHHFNQSLLFETAERLDPAVLAGALARLEEHHDALRMRYRRGPAGWEQTCAAPGAGDTPLVLADLSALDPAVQPAAVETAAAQAQTSLDLEAGPVHRPVLFDLGAGRPGRLLWAVHHLVVDGVSWRVLLEDLAAAHGRLAQGRQAELPAKTTSFRTWGERLAEHAASPKVRAELAHWLALPWGEVRPLAVDLVAEGNTLASERVVAFSLDPEETRALLQEVPRAYNTQINDALLSALARAFQAWTGSPVLLVNLEGHGREEVMPEVDLSRTVGWLTTVFPVLLDLREGSDPGTALKSVKEQLRRIPGRGLTWGVLRGTVPELAALPRPEVGFNYLGQLDQALPAGAPFRPARERSGPQRSPRAARPHLLDWNGTVFDGRLQIACSFSEQVHRRATVVKLAEGVAASLRELIAHCRSPQAGGYTPSDFPLTGLSQTKLDKILAARKKAAR